MNGICMRLIKSKSVQLSANCIKILLLLYYPLSSAFFTQVIQNLITRNIKHKKSIKLKQIKSDLCLFDCEICFIFVHLCENRIVSQMKVIVLLNNL